MRAIGNELDGCKKNLERAKKHIVDLNTAVDEFVASKPYKFRVDLDWNYRQVIKYAQLTRPIPDEIYFAARDAIYGIRVPLDHMTCQLAIKNVKSTNGVSFPIAGSAKEFGEAQAQGKIRKLAPAAQAFICGLNPYLGGDNLLWAVGNINNPDKHVDLVPIGLSGGGMMGSLGIGGTGYVGELIIGSLTWSAMDESMEVMRFSMDTTVQLQDNREPVLNIAFREMSPIKYRPIVGLVTEAHTRVSEIITEAEKRFFP